MGRTGNNSTLIRTALKIFPKFYDELIQGGKNVNKNKQKRLKNKLLSKYVEIQITNPVNLKRHAYPLRHGKCSQGQKGLLSDIKPYFQHQVGQIIKQVHVEKFSPGDFHEAAC